MNRRGFFSLAAKLPFVAAPVAAALGAEASAAPIADLPQPSLKPMLGQVRYVAYTVPDHHGSHTHSLSSVETPGHTHMYSHAGHSQSWMTPRAVSKLEIYDGAQWVEFMSPTGADVINRVLAR